MKSYENTPRKIDKLDRQSKENQNELIKKEYDYSIAHPREYAIKTPKVLYDSDWVGYATNATGSTAIQGDPAPLQTFFDIHQNINVPSAYLGFAKLTIMVKKQPEMDLVGVFPFQPTDYLGKNYSSGDSYQEIWGDSSLIYKGYNAPVRYKTQAMLQAGEFSVADTTRWFRGSNLSGVYSLKWTDVDGKKWRWRRATAYIIETYWDVTDVGEGHLNYKYWKGFSFTNITGSSVSGYGHYKTVTWTEDPPDTWDSVTTNSFGYKSSVPLFQNTTKIGCQDGFLYYYDTGEGKWVYQPTYGSTRWIITDGDFSGLSDDTITAFAFYEDDTYQLHWASDKLGWEVDVDGIGLSNMPTRSQYTANATWGGSAPHSVITHKVNPGNNPITKLDDMDVKHPYEFMCWTKTKDPLVYKLNVKGRIWLASPARESVAYTADVYNDGYTPEVSGDFYELTDENHTDKSLSFYKALAQDIEIRVLVTLISPIDIVDTKRLEIKEF